ncbi:MAG: hypothetical protein HRU00_14170 [Myxococcales bacterium]|jgi:hypothetical protein|nr:hypothetical protein [Myxococcales bacterium]
MARFNSRKVTVRMQGAAGNGMTIGPGPGDFTHGATNKGNSEKLRVLDRGAFDCHVEGDDLEQEFSITVGQKAESATSALVARVMDFIKQTGVFTPVTGLLPTQSVSSNPDIWAWETVVTMVLGATTATFTIPYCIGDYAFAEAMEGNSISISGTNNGDIVRT